MDRLAMLLKEIRPEFDFSTAENFFAMGMLDSFDMMSLVSALDNHYGISIKGAEIVPENFCNLNAIAALLRKYGA
jgi:acyl carrier protein